MKKNNPFNYNAWRDNKIVRNGVEYLIIFAASNFLNVTVETFYGYKIKQSAWYRGKGYYRKEDLVEYRKQHKHYPKMSKRTKL